VQQRLGAIHVHYSHIVSLYLRTLTCPL
jgi:hypothetical protein